MIFALLFLAQPEPAVEVPPPQEDIIAIGKRLESWSGSLKEVRGVRSCQTVDSTGDAEIDSIGCKALSDCYFAIKPEIVAVAKAHKDQDSRNKAMEPLQKEIGACIRRSHDDQIAKYVERKRTKVRR